MHAGSYLFSIAALAGVLVLSDPLTIDRCPFYHLSEITDGSEVNTHDLKFVAVCMSKGDKPEYKSSSLNFTECINNNQARLTDADEEVPYPGPFSGSCIDCGIATTEPVGEGDSDWRVHLRCQCADKDQPKDMHFTEISLDEVLDVMDTGYISCGGRDDNVINGDPVSMPAHFLDAGMASTSSSSTSTSTSTTATETTVSKASTVTITVTTNPDAPTKKCPAAKHVTVTETETETHNAKAKTKTKTITETETETKTKKKHKKTKTETETTTQTVTAIQKITETALASVHVTLYTATVYMTPSPSLLISASLQTTVKAIFTTITVPVEPIAAAQVAAEPPVATAEPDIVIVNHGIPASAPPADVPVAETTIFPAGTV